MVTKPCPYCAEQIQEAAVVCRFCGRRLGTRPGLVLGAIVVLAAGAGAAILAPWDRLGALADPAASDAAPAAPARARTRRPPAASAPRTAEVTPLPGESVPASSVMAPEGSSPAAVLGDGRVTPKMLRAIVRVESRGLGTGSGFFVSPDGHLLTSLHVVKDASLVDVELHDGTTETLALVAAEEIGDVALLKLSGRGPVDCLELSDASKRFVPRSAVVIGYPGGGHEPVVTRGIVAARGRQLDVLAPWEIFRLTNAVDPGNSGGPVLDLWGRVIAMVTAKATRTLSRVTFATPINYASQLPFPDADVLATTAFREWIDSAREAGQRPPAFAVPAPEGPSRESKAAKVAIEGFHRRGKGFAVLVALTDAAGRSIAPRASIEVRLTWDAIEEDRRLTEDSRCETFLHAGEEDYFSYGDRVVAQVEVDCPELDVGRVTGIRVEVSVDGVDEPAVHVE